MHDTYSPPLWAVLGCLANVIVSVAMIWYLIIFLSSCSSCAAEPFAYVFFIGFLHNSRTDRFRTLQTVISRQKEIQPDGFGCCKNCRNRYRALKTPGILFLIRNINYFKMTGSAGNKGRGPST